jgi:hypothetical protein
MIAGGATQEAFWKSVSTFHEKIFAPAVQA